MAFDDTQLAALRTAINAGISAPITTAAQTRNDTELARLLNLDSSFWVWRSVVATEDILEAVNWSSFTPQALPDGSALYSQRQFNCQLKRDNMRVLLERSTLPTGRPNIRTSLTDALLNVPAGAGGADLDAGWLGTGKVKAVISRLATVAERALITTGTGAAGTPGTLVAEGKIDIDAVGRMWNLPA